MFIPSIHAYREWLNLIQDLHSAVFIFVTKRTSPCVLGEKEELLLLRRMLQISKETLLLPDAQLVLILMGLRDSIGTLKRDFDTSDVLQRSENTSLNDQLLKLLSILVEKIHEYEFSLDRQRKVYCLEEPLFLGTLDSPERDVELTFLSTLILREEGGFIGYLRTVFGSMPPASDNRKRKRRNLHNLPSQSDMKSITIHQLIRKAYGYCILPKSEDNDGIYESCIKRSTECAEFIVELLGMKDKSEICSIRTLRVLINERDLLQNQMLHEKVCSLLFCACMACSTFCMDTDFSTDALEVTLWALALIGNLDLPLADLLYIESCVLRPISDKLLSRNITTALVQRLASCVAQMNTSGQIYLLDPKYTKFLGASQCIHLYSKSNSAHPLVLLIFSLIRQSVQQCLEKAYFAGDNCGSDLASRASVLRTIRSISPIVSFAPDLLGNILITAIVEVYSSCASVVSSTVNFSFEYISVECLFLDYGNFDEHTCRRVWTKLTDALARDEKSEYMFGNTLTMMQDLWVACATWKIPISHVLDSLVQILRSKIASLRCEKLSSSSSTHALTSLRHYQIVFGILYLVGVQLKDLKHAIREWTLFFFTESPVSAWINMAVCFHLLSSEKYLKIQYLYDKDNDDDGNNNLLWEFCSIMTSVRNMLYSGSEPAKLVATLLTKFLSLWEDEVLIPNDEKAKTYNCSFWADEKSLYDQILLKGAETSLLSLLLSRKSSVRPFFADYSLEDTSQLSIYSRAVVNEHEVRSQIICRMVCSTSEARYLARELLKACNGRNRSLDMLISTHETKNNLPHVDSSRLLRSTLECELYPEFRESVCLQDICSSNLMTEMMLQSNHESHQKMKWINGLETKGFFVDFLEKTIASIHLSRCFIGWSKDDNRTESTPRKWNFRVISPVNKCQYCEFFSMFDDISQIFSAYKGILVQPLIVYTIRWHLYKFLNIDIMWDLWNSENSKSNYPLYINHFCYLLGCLDLLNCVEIPIFAELVAYIFDRDLMRQIVHLLNAKEGSSCVSAKPFFFAWIARFAGLCSAKLGEMEVVDIKVWYLTLPLYALSTVCVLDPNYHLLDAPLRQELMNFLDKFSVKLMYLIIGDKSGQTVGSDMPVGSLFPTPIDFEYIDGFSVLKYPTLSEPLRTEGDDTKDKRMVFAFVCRENVLVKCMRITMIWKKYENGLSQLFLTKSIKGQMWEDYDICNIHNELENEMILPTFLQLQSVYSMQLRLKQESCRQATRSEWCPFSNSAIELLLSSSHEAPPVDSSLPLSDDLVSNNLPAHESSFPKKVYPAKSSLLTRAYPLRQGYILSPVVLASVADTSDALEEPEADLIEDPPVMDKIEKEEKSSVERKEKWRNQDVSSIDLVKKFGVSF